MISENVNESEEDTLRIALRPIDLLNEDVDSATHIELDP
jgi:hypothetical protein